MAMYYHNFIVLIGLVRIFGSIISIRMHDSVYLLFFTISLLYKWYMAGFYDCTKQQQQQEEKKNEIIH